MRPCRVLVRANVKCDKHNSRISFVFAEFGGYLSDEVNVSAFLRCLREMNNLGVARLRI